MTLCRSVIHKRVQQMRRAVESEVNIAGLRVNADKCKVMTILTWDIGDIEAEESVLKVVHNFYYFGSYI